MKNPGNIQVVRAGLLMLLVIEVAGIAWLVLNPSPEVPTRSVLDLSSWLRRQGVPDALADEDVVEFCLNVTLFVPLGFLCASLVPRLRLATWVVLGLLVSCALELVQRELLPDRSSTLRDITANTLGMFVGAGAVTSVRWMVHVWRVDHPNGPAPEHSRRMP